MIVEKKDGKEVFKCGKRYEKNKPAKKKTPAVKKAEPEKPDEAATEDKTEGGF